MEDTIFTRIIKGEIACHKVYEDELTLAFLDINPTQPGHTLVIPKRQVEFLWDLDDTDYQAVMTTAKKVSLHIRQTLKVKYVGVKVIGEDVPHAHVHLVPFNAGAEFYSRRPAESDSDHAALAKMAETLAF